MRVVRRLAESPVSEVLLVETDAGERRVTKRVRAHLAGTPFADQFLADAELACTLVHPNVVRTLAAATGADGAPYLVMEHLDGVDLRTVAKTARAGGERVAPAVALAIGARIAAGLAYAHALEGGGLVHRDVSPHNVFLTEAGEVKLIDFDIAVPAAQASCEQPIPFVTGKLPYMAPEQLEGLALDARTDLFGLGVILWELLTGRRLFKRETEGETALAVREGSVLPPSVVDPELPGDVDPIVLSLLAKFACSRPDCARTVAVQLDALATRLGLDDARAPGAIAELVSWTRAEIEAAEHASRASLF